MSKANNPGFVLSPYSQKKILKALGSHQEKTDATSKRHGKPTRYNIATSDYDNLVSGEHGPLILKVRRGKIVTEKHYCAECHSYISPIRAYADSNYGKVHLCTPCHLAAFNRSFGHADAMPLKLDHAHAHKGKWK
ncbi:TPA: hypothetical protein P1K84_004978 [Klebsiella quasipneumoniae]|nr:hypothetical protein [Klebsiella quasipneumoniae]HDN2743549.1 hypothetical protein [Klebsiella quasipneumoniae]